VRDFYSALKLVLEDSEPYILIDNERFPEDGGSYERYNGKQPAYEAVQIKIGISH
jgi:hypothetical protein